MRKLRFVGQSQIYGSCDFSKSDIFCVDGAFESATITNSEIEIGNLVVVHGNIKDSNIKAARLSCQQSLVEGIAVNTHSFIELRNCTFAAPGKKLGPGIYENAFVIFDRSSLYWEEAEVTAYVSKNELGYLNIFVASPYHLEPNTLSLSNLLELIPANEKEIKDFYDEASNLTRYR